jgi:gas vesicle protein
MLLFAPQAGNKTRAELRKGAEDLRNRTSEVVKESTAHARDRANQIKADVQLTAGELQRKGRDLIVRQLDRVSQAAEAGKKAVQNPQPAR